MSRRPAGLTGCVLALTLALLLGFNSARARAHYDPLGSGATRLKLDRGLLALLKQNGVKLSAVAPARLSGGVVTFPVSGGKFDPVAAKGVVEHEGALLFTAAARSLPLKALQLKTSRQRSPFAVKAGGGQLKLGPAARVTISREGFGDRVKASALSLSAKLAGRLSKKLHLRGAIKEGQPLGSTLTRTEPLTISLLGKGRAELTLDPGISAKLASLFVAVNPIFPAEHMGPLFTLPIFGGTLAPDASLGTVETQGALEFLQLGGGQVFWHGPWLEFTTRSFSPEADVEPSPPYMGKIGRVPSASLALAGPVSAAAAARTVAVSGATLSLGASTAQVFNEVFAKPQGKDGVFKAGETLASVAFLGQGQ